METKRLRGRAVQQQQRAFSYCKFRSDKISLKRAHRQSILCIQELKNITINTTIDITQPEVERRLAGSQIECTHDQPNVTRLSPTSKISNARQRQRRRSELTKEAHEQPSKVTNIRSQVNYPASRRWKNPFQLLIPLLLLVTCSIQSFTTGQQFKPEWPQKLVEQEIFLLNLEDGYFGCQVNASQDFLQLFELSRLCDGQPQCYLGSDELDLQLKCRARDKCDASVVNNSNSTNEELAATTTPATKCVNGVCLDGLCYCNDGFGGKSCDIPDENECKFRPCDVFAHCTNTMGSYYCSCFPGKCLIRLGEF